MLALVRVHAASLPAAEVTGKHLKLGLLPSIQGLCRHGSQIQQCRHRSNTASQDDRTTEKHLQQQYMGGTATHLQYRLHVVRVPQQRQRKVG